MGEHSIPRDEASNASNRRDDARQDRSADLPSDQPEEVHAGRSVSVCERSSLPSGAELSSTRLSRFQRRLERLVAKISPYSSSPFDEKLTIG